MFLHNHRGHRQTSNINIDGIAIYFAANCSHVQKRDDWEAQHPKIDIFFPSNWHPEVTSRPTPPPKVETFFDRLHIL